MLKHKPTEPLHAGAENTAFRFACIALTSDRETVVCKLSNGKFYELPVGVFSSLESWDRSGVCAVDTIDGGYGALLVLESGKKIDFAADFVLHHCEPQYAHHHARVKPSKIGSRIREIRTAKRLTLKDVEAKTGIKEPNLSRLENDKHVPSIQTLAKIARAMQVDVSDLIGARHSVTA